jgi:hypothetical protein
MQPGKPMAMMLFKTYGYMSMYQGMYFSQDLKLGKNPHYSPHSSPLFTHSNNNQVTT